MSGSFGDWEGKVASGLPEHAVCVFVGVICFCVVASEVISMRSFVVGREVHTCRKGRPLRSN